MKNPKDKAEELLNKIMASTENAKLSDYSQIYSPTAKKIALLMVDEILNIYQIKNAEFEFYDVRNYWQDVKQELEK